MEWLVCSEKNSVTYSFQELWTGFPGGDSQKEHTRTSLGKKELHPESPDTPTSSETV